MNLTDLKPVAHLQQSNYNKEQWGHQILSNSGKEIDKADIIIVGVAEDRKGNSSGASQAPNLVRSAIYELYNPNKNIQVMDLGDIPAGPRLNDTYAQLAELTSQLVAEKIAIVVIGGTQNLAYAQYQGYAALNHYVNLGIIDKQIRLDKLQADDEAGIHTYLNGIIKSKPNYLFNLMHLGYQTYLTGEHKIKLLENLHYDHARLGMLREDIKDAEPLLRDLDALSISLDVLKSAELTGSPNNSPNGMYAEELAQVVRYAAMGDKLSSIGFYDYNPLYDQMSAGTRLIAQLIWYFAEGYGQRVGDWPKHNSERFLNYTIHHEKAEDELVFLKSRKTGRWWLEMPIERAESKKQYFVPCSYKDYQTALQGELPLRWLHAWNKLG